MISDFAISLTGDIIFDTNPKANNFLKISFALSNTNATKIIFDLVDFDTESKKDETLKISFDLVKSTADKSVVLLKDKEALSQLVTLKLRTSLGELPEREKFGSMISTLRHKEINNLNLQKLNEYVKDCLSDILSNPQVKSIPYIDYTNGYMQTVKIYIYDDNKNAIEYILER